MSTPPEYISRSLPAFNNVLVSQDESSSNWHPSSLPRSLDPSSF